MNLVTCKNENKYIFKVDYTKFFVFVFANR